MQIDRVEETTDAQGNPECFVSGSVTDSDTGDVVPFAKWLSPSEYTAYLAGTKIPEVLTNFSKWRLQQHQEEKELVVKVPKELMEKLRTSVETVAIADAKTSENALKDRVSTAFSDSIKQILAIKDEKVIEEQEIEELKKQSLGDKKR